MPEARRREVDVLLRGLTPKHQRQLSVSTSNALERFSVIEAVVQHRRLVLLLDYDGTLTPIVNDPSKAVLSERVRSILCELPKHFITGVISGRSLGKIRNFVDVPGLFYAGSHGFDILAPSHTGYSGSLGIKRGTSPTSSSRSQPASPCEENSHKALSTTSSDGSPTDGGCSCGDNGIVNGAQDDEAGAVSNGAEVPFGEAGTGNVLEEVRHQVAAEYLPVMATIRDQLVAALKGIDRAEVEDNRFSISIHYRNCARVDVPRVQEVVLAVQAKHKRIRMGSGKEVFELQPDIAWDKGKAVLWLLDKLVMPMVSTAGAAASTGEGVGDCGGSEEEGAEEAVGVDCVDVGEEKRTGDGKEGLKFEEEEEEEEEEDDDDVDEDDGKFFTIFIGDDKTDENAFRALNGDMDPKKVSHEGLGILVSEESRETNAAYTLRNPNEVASFLEKIAQLGSKTCCSAHR